MIELIQKSLTQDFRNLLTVRKVAPRRDIDKIYQCLIHASVSDLTAWNKALTSSLASDPNGGLGAKIGDELIVPLLGDPQLIRAVRQVLGFFSRLHANVTEEAKLAQLAAAADRLAAPADIRWTSTEKAIMRRFIWRVLGRAPDLRDLRFRHGPGAVATGERGIEKIYFKETYHSVDALLGEDSESLFRLPHQPSRVLPRVEPTTRVIAVPKDAVTIRTISCEPLSMMFLQQGIMDAMYARMFRPNWIRTFPFETQAIQQARAQRGSSAYEWGRPHQICTVDLSSASDDVKVDHVTELFPRDWVDLLLACRSTYANFHELGREVELLTFAPMGAATCFPVESLVFAAITYCALLVEGTHSVRGDWGVVGDDITVFSYAYYRVLDLLERGGFHPNLSKCCGPLTRFRESCGGDFYEGEDVTYVRPRALPNYRNRKATVPMVQLANGLLTRGFRQTAQTLASLTRGPVSLGYGPAHANPGLNWPVKGYIRFNRRLQRWEQKALVAKPKPSTPLGAVDGWEPLFNWFTSGWRTETFFPSREFASYAWLEIEPPQDE